MPKRTNEEMIQRYRRKLRKLETKQLKYNKIIIYSSEDSEQSDNDNIEPNIEPQKNHEDIEHTHENDTEEIGVSPPISNSEPALSELDPDILSALGETTEAAPKFGPNIHNKLSLLWLPILKKGLNRETKEKLFKEYLIPENCSLLQAPKLNPEILAAVSDSTRTRDKKVEAVQQQLGQGIAALNKGLELLLDEGKERLLAIKFLSDSCRILCDLHYVETEARKKFVTPGLDKKFLSIVQDVDRDDLLFGNKLQEKIKATKTIEKQGLQIKKPPSNPKMPSTSATYHQYRSTSRSHQSGNWTGPPRSSSNRRERGGHRGRGAMVGRKLQSTCPSQQRPTQAKQPRATVQR